MEMRRILRSTTGVLTILVVVLGGSFGIALAADSSDVNQATKQVESGAKEAGKGISEMGQGVGKTVVEGAKLTGEKIKEAGEKAEPTAKEVGKDVEEGATSAFTSVKNFFGRLFGGK
jgi:hypothetical protein